MKRQTILRAALCIGLFSLIFIACSKNNDGNEQTVPAGKQNLSLMLTDGPGFFDNVSIDIKSVQVLVDTCGNSSLWQGIASGCQMWETLSIKPGVYNLLSLRNGTDTLLAQGNVINGKVVLVKIELGTNNSLIKDSVKYPLHLAKITDPYIYLTLTGNEWERYEKNKSRLWLDFDVARSVVLIGNDFFLKPVIHVFVKSTTGAVGGVVSPMAAFPVISVYNSKDTAYALPNRDGVFLVRGLAPGTYSLNVNASNGYRDTTITNLNIKVGQLDLQKIVLRKQ
ncbi:DUF4382 domain-containing protein [Pinibacter soli]|uniref:DUF4382 domain-containing protein n=1 Tax=Pinibacter soli TaxID=3044211 RepID=A0ABT6R8V7_9BACT|nr:DUF4382 domain-containing protein [Pinibacter soli]MDI3318995.1 DUF4382 domain-containing protein [Pinibacter soli]